MDFIKRLFGGSTAPPVVIDSSESAVAEPDAVTVSPSATTAPPATTASEAAGVTVEPSAHEIAWRRVTTEMEGSTYVGEVDGVQVATIVKHEGADAGREPWEWRLDVPTNGAAAGNARVLRDAKPAAETALADWRP